MKRRGEKRDREVVGGGGGSPEGRERVREFILNIVTLDEDIFILKN